MATYNIKYKKRIHSKSISSPIMDYKKIICFCFVQIVRKFFILFVIVAGTPALISSWNAASYFMLGRNFVWFQIAHVVPFRGSRFQVDLQSGSMIQLTFFWHREYCLSSSFMMSVIFVFISAISLRVLHIMQGYFSYLFFRIFITVKLLASD